MSTNFCMILLVLYYWVRSSRLLNFLWIPASAAATVLIILMILTPSLADDVGTFLINCKPTFIDRQRSLPRNSTYFIKSSSQYFPTSFRVFGTERQLQETGYKYDLRCTKNSPKSWIRYFISNEVLLKYEDHLRIESYHFGGYLGH